MRFIARQDRYNEKISKMNFTYFYIFSDFVVIKAYFLILQSLKRILLTINQFENSVLKI